MIITLISNVLLKLSNNTKPESLVSELDYIFLDSADIYTAAMLVTNIYPLVSFFYESVESYIDTAVCVFQLGILYILSLFQGWLYAIKLLHVFQLSMVLENLSYQEQLWIVRLSSVFITITSITISILVYKTYPYDIIIYPAMITSSDEFNKQQISENPVLLTFYTMNIIMILLIMKEKIKLNEDKQKYVKAAILLIAMIVFLVLGTFALIGCSLQKKTNFYQFENFMLYF